MLSAVPADYTGVSDWFLDRRCALLLCVAVLGPEAEAGRLSMTRWSERGGRRADTNARAVILDWWPYCLRPRCPCGLPPYAAAPNMPLSGDDENDRGIHKSTKVR